MLWGAAILWQREILRGNDFVVRLQQVLKERDQIEPSP